MTKNKKHPIHTGEISLFEAQIKHLPFFTPKLRWKLNENSFLSEIVHF